MLPICIPPTRFVATPEYLLLTFHGATIISVPVHCFGMYCVLYKTPDQMKSVKWYFVNLHIWIILYDYSVCLLTIPMLLLPSMSGYTLGVLSRFNVPIVLQAVLILMFLSYVLISILAIFENRFHVVCNFGWKRYWTSIRPMWLGFHYFIEIVIVIPFFFLTPDQDQARKLVFKQLPCLPDYILKAPVYVLADDFTYHMTAMVSFTATGTLESIIFILLTFFNTIQQLRSHKMSRHLFEIQMKFFIALVIQMLIPLFFLIIPLSYAIFSIFFNYYNQGITNTGLTLELFHGTVSTLVMILIHRPYREALFDFVGKQWKGLPNSQRTSHERNGNHRAHPIRNSLMN